MAFLEKLLPGIFIRKLIMVRDFVFRGMMKYVTHFLKDFPRPIHFATGRRLSLQEVWQYVKKIMILSYSKGCAQHCTE